MPRIFQKSEPEKPTQIQLRATRGVYVNNIAHTPGDVFEVPLSEAVYVLGTGRAELVNASDRSLIFKQVDL